MPFSLLALQGISNEVKERGVGKRGDWIDFICLWLFFWWSDFPLWLLIVNYYHEHNVCDLERYCKCNGVTLWWQFCARHPVSMVTDLYCSCFVVKALHWCLRLQFCICFVWQQFCIGFVWWQFCIGVLWWQICPFLVVTVFHWHFVCDSFAMAFVWWQFCHLLFCNAFLFTISIDHSLYWLVFEVFTVIC